MDAQVWSFFCTKWGLACLFSSQVITEVHYGIPVDVVININVKFTFGCLGYLAKYKLCECMCI
jgi:hypothetical protein